MAILLPKDRVFYTYALLDPRKPKPCIYDDIDPNYHWSFSYEPFYVGKGKGERLTGHKAKGDYNKHKTNKIRKIENAGLEVIRVILASGLSEKKAYELERHLISVIGRSDQKIGPLTNLTSGGLGVSELSKAQMKERVKTRKKKPNYADMVKRISESNRKSWASKSKEVMQAFSRTVSDIHKNRSESEKAKISKRISKALNSPDVLKKRSKSFKATWASKSADEIQAMQKKRLATREARGQALLNQVRDSYKEAMKRRSPEKQARIASAHSKKMLARTPEQKAESRRKQQETRLRNLGLL